MTEKRPARKPRVVSLGKTWIGSPVPDGLQRKFGVMSRHIDFTVITTGPVGARRVSGVRVLSLPALKPRLLGGALFYPCASLLGVALAAASPGTAIQCMSPYEAAGVLALRRFVPGRRRPRVVLEVHGDWRTATRLYGSGWRRLLSPLTDRVAAWAVRSADRVRIIGTFTEGLVRAAGRQGTLDQYIAWSEYDEFLTKPPVSFPPRPTATFVGVLEPYKAPHLLIEAWPQVRQQLPRARLRLVGAGPLEATLRTQAAAVGVAEAVEFHGHVPQRRLVELLDDSSCLVLPSPAEGLGRVLYEAMARSRPVVGSNSGGIPEVVEDGVTGRLFAPRDSAALAEALVDVLADAGRAAAMGAAGRARTEARDPAREFEAGLARLAEWVAAG